MPKAYLIRNLPDDLWEAVRRRCDEDQIPIRSALLFFMRAYANRGLGIGPMADLGVSKPTDATRLPANTRFGRRYSPRTPAITVTSPDEDEVMEDPIP